jgi:uracil-DNA glycosylase
VDNPYRDPNPGFQLLHALENKCIVTGGSLAVDGFEVARQLKEESPEMFRVCHGPHGAWRLAPFLHLSWLLNNQWPANGSC